MYRPIAIVVLAVAAAGCGGGHHGATGTTTTVATLKIGTTTAAAVQPACARLNAATRGAVSQIGTSLSRFGDVSSAAALSRRTSGLERQLTAASARVDGVRTPPGPLTQDKQAISQAFDDIGVQLHLAHKAVVQGRISVAAKDFASLARLTTLRHAAKSLARDCPQH